ncbi:EF-hand domain-containing family member C2-like [Lingula anatina]|uniref:EF-hand domain-containing family member C2 n=1 Tax=Lingula anatina TaxID=7574 RepID=A0A1S3KBE9_LINAN|nr:EF-hand domain-containing family member C2-like [Lingula anatina]|eukprot:XP_013419576.1 EF-hand domain-containing family member C2-like [Lingula anatina]
MALPNLPGNSFNPNLGKTRYHKSHHFDYRNEVSMMVGEEKPGIGGELLAGQKITPKNSVFPSGEGGNLPAWVAFDRQVLCFDAYFQEAVHEKREEQYRIRNSKIYFYLEDDSIQVIEPRMKNAGVPQGTLIRRHRIPRPAPYDDTFYTVEDFNVGNEVNLYSRIFKITGCDEFTHNFLRKLGVKVNAPEAVPADPYTKYRKAMDESMQPMRPYEKYDTLKQFLDHDRHVLRFYCHWDDTDSMFGDPRQMVLHYFLADDTIEIREIIQANSGRDAAPMFLRRARLPKEVSSLRQPGEKTDRTVLNVFGPTGHGGRYILDSLKTGAVHEEFYKDSDLMIGSVVSAWGRKILLCDADDFTKEYYRTKYGINNFTPIQYKGTPQGRRAREMPPYNGFGSEEDSLCSCMGLIPKPPRRDFVKFMEKDRHGLESNVLRFLARMDTTKPIDMDRRFIISYFLSDDTILVFEPPVRNSGIIGGKFLERGRVKKPDQPPYSTRLSEYYMAPDLYVGGLVIFNNHKFLLIDADEYAFRYMEQHSDEFPQANVDRIFEKLKELSKGKTEEVKSFFMRNDPSNTGNVQYEQFRNLLMQLSENRLAEHEIMTVGRHYMLRKDDDGVDLNTLAYIIQDLLRKHNFDININKLPDGLLQADANKCGYLHPEVVMTACKALRLPVPRDLVWALMTKCEINQEGLLKYDTFLQYLDWKNCPVVAPPNFQGTLDETWKGTMASKQVQVINYQALLNDAFGFAAES